MIENLEVKNFKSIKHLKLDCKRVNIFIGKPNTGKSNILESVGIFSSTYGTIQQFVRYESMINLFYDQNPDEKIEIAADDNLFTLIFKESLFRGNCKGRNFSFNFTSDYSSAVSQQQIRGTNSPFKFYKFEIIKKFPSKELDSLLPPQGENLLSILISNKDLRKLIAEIYKDYGFRIVLKPQENRIEIQKEIEDVIISHPYSLVSDTLQRIVFYLAAIETNKDSIIIFEEPESHAFPYYTKFLAERISLDNTNQYFISTHNPYFLLSILEKTPKGDIGIFITYFEDYQTKVKSLTEEEMQEVLDLDASLFFNLDRFLVKE